MRPRHWKPSGPTSPSSPRTCRSSEQDAPPRSEEHTSELQSHSDLVCRLLLEKKKITLELRADRGRSGQMREVNRVLSMGDGIMSGVADRVRTAAIRTAMGSPALLSSMHHAVH